MAKKRFDARELMELAVRVMRDTVKEHRADNKASPLVGAVLWRPDGSVTTACRGELLNVRVSGFAQVPDPDNSPDALSGLLSGFIGMKESPEAIGTETGTLCPDPIAFEGFGRIGTEIGTSCPGLTAFKSSAISERLPTAKPYAAKTCLFKGEIGWPKD